MAPLKKGLDYFPLAHEIFDDENFVELQIKYGPLGEAIYFRLLSLIFRNGYYYRFDSLDKLAAKLIKSIGNRWARDKKTVIDVILFLAENNLFSSELMRENVITSRDVQLRYTKAMERRQSTIAEYNLLDGNEVREGTSVAPANGENAAEAGGTVTTAEDTAAISPPRENENKTKQEKGARAPAVIDREFLVGEYGEGNVIEYEARFERWRQGKQTLNLPKYETIFKWLRQDGKKKPVNRSSFDMDETLRRIAQRYSDG